MSNLGPSYTVDTACSSAVLALQVAVDAIRANQCDQAIVGGAHVTLMPNSALQFLRLGMLSPTGKCQSFDAKGESLLSLKFWVCVKYHLISFQAMATCVPSA